jgi:hypothetical protein
LWAPEDDTLAAASFSQNTTNTATFTPDPASVGGTYRIKLTVVEGLNTTEVIRCFSILTVNTGLRIPALNERANEAATLSSGPSLIEDSEFNEPSPGPFAGGNYGGWYKALADTIRRVEFGAGGTGDGSAPFDAPFFLRYPDSRLPDAHSIVAQDNVRIVDYPDHIVVSGRSPAFTMNWGDVGSPDIIPDPNIIAGTTLWINNGATAYTVRSLQAPFSEAIPSDITYIGHMLTIVLVNAGTANITFLHHGAPPIDFLAFDCPGAVSRILAPGESARVTSVFTNGNTYWKFVADPFAFVTMAGDVTGTSNANKVVRIQNSPVPVPTTGVLTANAGVLTWSAISGITLAGDVTGTAGANTVTKIQNVPVPVPSNGVLTSNSGTLAWTPSGVFNVRTYGAIGNGVANDAPAIQAAISAAGTAGGGRVYLPTGTYNITAPLALVDKMEIFGDGPNSTIITSSNSLLTLLNAEGPVSAWCLKIHDLQFLGGGGGDAQLFFHGVSDALLIENCTFKNGATGIKLNSNLLLNTVIQRCMFVNTLGGAPSGTAIKMQDSLVNLQIDNCDFRSLEICVHAPNGMKNITLRGGESTACKKLVYAPGTGAPQPGVLYVSNMKLSPSQIGASTALFLPTDRDFIYNYSGSNIRVEGNYAVDSVAASVDWNLAFHSSCRVTSTGNDYPNNSPFAPGGPAGAFTGGIWSAADRYVDGVSPDLVPLPSRMGGINVPGTATLSNSQTSISVPLLLNEWNTDYHIRLDLEGAVSPTAGATSGWVSNKTQSSFWINIATGPGQGDSVTFTYVIWR